MPPGEIQIRQAKLARLQEAGHDPHGEVRLDVRPLAEVRTRFETGGEKGPARIAGRIMLWRDMGRSIFATLRDGSDDLQVYLKKDRLGAEAFVLLKDHADLGDFLYAEGEVDRTRTGETTLFCDAARLVAKALRPLPAKWHGLADTEIRYRHRHLDLVVNPEVRRTFERRAAIIRETRACLDERGYVEVETPALQPLYGGAAARPFTTEHHALGMRLYLRISDELYLKRLIVGGMERVYEIAKNFRNEGIDRFHNPEFTLLECYQAWADYGDMMDLTETLVRRLAVRATGSTRVTWQGRTRDFGPPWQRLRFVDAIRDRAEIDVLAASETALRERARALGGRDEPGWSRARLMDEIFSVAVEPHLQDPTFVTDHPLETTPLAKRHRSDPRLVERFEAFAFGREFANAYSELNDPVEQRRRFEAQMGARAKGDEEAQVLDEAFLAAMEQGMPPTGGLGIGIDRLCMFLTDAASIRDVILFPLLRPAEGDDV